MLAFRIFNVRRKIFMHQNHVMSQNTFIHMFNIDINIKVFIAT